MKFKMADKDLLVNNLQHYFGIFEAQMKQFFKDMFSTQHTQETMLKIGDCLFKTNTKLSEFNMIFGTNYIVLGKLNATEHDYNVWNSLLIRYNKLMEMLSLGIHCTIKLIENLEPKGACLIPEIYPDLCGLVNITSSYTGDMISNIIQDIFYFQDNPTSPWFDIGDPIDRPKSSSTTPTYLDCPITSTPSDLPETLNTTTQDISTSQTTSNHPPTIETPILIGSEIQNTIIDESNDLDGSIGNKQIKSKTSIPIIIENNSLTQIKVEINDNSPITSQDPPTFKAELDNSLLISQNPTSSVTLPSPNSTINIKAKVDIDSQPLKIETLYHPDMDNSSTGSNYDSNDLDYSDFEDFGEDFLEAREREGEFLLTYGNIWKHIPPRRCRDPFG